MLTDFLAAICQSLIEKVSVFRNLTEIEKTNISNRSTKLFTLSSIFQGTVSLLRKSQNSKKVSKKEESIAISYWENVCNNMKDWQLAAEKSVSTHELRQNYIHSHALAMHAIGRLGASLLSTVNKDYKKELKKLKKVDWARKNKALWEGRAMIAGKISKSNNSVILTTNHLKNTFRLKLTSEEKKVEQEYLAKA